MKVVTLKDMPNVPIEGAEPIEGYTGPVSRSRQIRPGGWEYWANKAGCGHLLTRPYDERVDPPKG